MCEKSNSQHAPQTSRKANNSWKSWTLAKPFQLQNAPLDRYTKTHKRFTWDSVPRDAQNQRVDHQFQCLMAITSGPIQSLVQRQNPSQDIRIHAALELLVPLFFVFKINFSQYHLFKKILIIPLKKYCGIFQWTKKMAPEGSTHWTHAADPSEVHHGNSSFLGPLRVYCMCISIVCSCTW